jgi:hypothetical protein
MRKFAIILFIFNISILFSDSYYNTFYYDNLASEPVRFNPEQNIYYDGIKLELFSDQGKLFYLINKSLLEAEPVEYTKEIYLKGESNRVVDYDIVVMLEKDDGKIEFYSRTYRIDRTDQSKKYDYRENGKFSKNVTDKTDGIRVEYKFSDNFYNITNDLREFNFPVSISQQTDKNQIIDLNSKHGDKLIYMTGITYEKNDKLHTEIQNNTVDRETVKPPSFGSLYWGQYYRQSYRIKIKPYDMDDKVFYWFREWQNEDLIFGPPSVDNKEAWVEYKDPVELVSKFGKQGTFGIAGYSLGKNGEKSKISGPFYFKIDGIDGTFEQVFNDESSDNVLPFFTVNGSKTGAADTALNKDCLLHFDKSKDGLFYFTFSSEGYDGKSDLFPCEGDYHFKNNGKYPVDMILYRPNGEKLGSFTLNPDGMILPVLKKYTTNYIDVSSDEIISFYLPKNKIRYEVTTNQNKNLSVNQNSGIFTGRFRLDAAIGEETVFKIKFGSFDDNDNLITESQYYYLKIDKKSASKDVSSDGVDFSIFQNEQQRLKLIPPEKDSSVFYRLNKDSEWILYTEPVIFNPPITGLYEVNVFVRSVDKAGNIRENANPFTIKFDRRGIFVKSDRKFSGNGTESAPFNSIERAVYFAKLRNLKIIYLLSEEYNISVPVSIDSDIIIEPFNDRKISVNFETKSIWKKQHIWFDINKNGYLELRNLQLYVKSGFIFANMNKNKLKIYNTDFNFSGSSEFNFIKNDGGKIGINNLNFHSTGISDSLSFIDSKSGNIILKNIKSDFYARNVNVMNVADSKNVSIDSFNIDVTSDNVMKLINASGSSLNVNNMIYRQKGEFKNTSLIKLQNSAFELNESDFIIDGKNPFETYLINQFTSKTKISKSLFRVNRTFSSIAFNSTDSDLYFDRSMLDMKNAGDFVYNFRSDRSVLKIHSSIIRNLDSYSSVNFVLNRSVFEGSNNSIFNVNNVKKAFSFWINDKATITTVNSLYYYSDESEKSTFIFANNNDYSLITPTWYSNAISSDIVLLENLDKKDSQEMVNDFNDKNIYYLFDNDFNMNDRDFFIPEKDSPLLQGGLDDTKSPLKLSNLDFLGKLRILSGIGIDIGAIQKSGNF